MAGSGRSVGIFRLHDGAAIAPHQKGTQHATAARLTRHQFDEAGPVKAVELAIAVEITRHRGRLALKVAGIFENIGLGDVQRRLHDRLGANGKPPVQPDIERDRGEDRHQNGRRDRNDRKQRHDAHMQPRRGTATRTRLEQAVDLAGNQEDQADHEDGIDRRAGDHDIGFGPDRGQTEQDRQRNDRADQRAGRQHQAGKGKGCATVRNDHRPTIGPRWHRHPVSHRTCTFPCPAACVARGRRRSHEPRRSPCRLPKTTVPSARQRRRKSGNPRLQEARARRPRLQPSRVASTNPMWRKCNALQRQVKRSGKDRRHLTAASHNPHPCRRSTTLTRCATSDRRRRQARGFSCAACCG